MRSYRLFNHADPKGPAYYFAYRGPTPFCMPAESPRPSGLTWSPDYSMNNAVSSDQLSDNTAFLEDAGHTRLYRFLFYD